MAKDLSTQIHDILLDTRRPLIALPANTDADSFAAACALAHVLSSLGKQTLIACEKNIPSSLQFLIQQLSLVSSLVHLRSLAVSLPQGMKLRSVERMEHNGFTSLVLTPEEGTLTANNISLQHGVAAHDLLITLGTRELSSLGSLFRDHADSLSTMPILNIDWHPSNEEYGRWNSIDTQAGSVSEACANLLLSLSPESVANHVATCLLTGMIAKTKNFRSDRVTSATLATSAKLIERGAERMHIMENLYRTRSVDAMRLWGTVFSRIEEVAPGIFTSTIGRDDFFKTHTTPDHLEEIAQELLQSTAEAKIVVLLFEDEQANRALVAVNRPLDARQLCAATKMEGTRDLVMCSFEKEKSLANIREEIVQSLNNIS